MSKGNSYLFSGTSGSGKQLVMEVVSNNRKISPNKVLSITRDSNGKVVWIEEGNSHSGFQHIIEKHEHEFYGRGISKDEIPNYILEAVRQGNIVGYQGKKNPRPIYEFVYNGTTHRLAVQVSDNGYIVSANGVSSKE